MPALAVLTLACGLTGTTCACAARARDEEGVPWKPRHVRQRARIGQSRWHVKIIESSKKAWHFGTYNVRAHAARAADRAALVVFGEHTPLNLPGLLTAEERRVLSAVVDVDAYAEECRKAAPCAQPPKCCEYIGVYLPPGRAKFLAGVWVCDRNCHLGSFAASEDAARAYDEAAVLADVYAPKRQGGARELNFPSECKVRSSLHWWAHVPRCWQLSIQRGPPLSRAGQHILYWARITLCTPLFLCDRYGSR
jgi:hypothetical protein